MPGSIRAIFVALVTLVSSAAGLQASVADPSRPPPCSESWYPYIDGILVTGDGAGHGPDVGSGEWQSVVEFKLGIRGESDIPDRSTRAWCEFIDALVSKDEK